MAFNRRCIPPPVHSIRHSYSRLEFPVHPPHANRTRWALEIPRPPWWSYFESYNSKSITIVLQPLGQTVYDRSPFWCQPDELQTDDVWSLDIAYHDSHNALWQPNDYLQSWIVFQCPMGSCCSRYNYDVQWDYKTIGSKLLASSCPSVFVYCDRRLSKKFKVFGYRSAWEASAFTLQSLPKWLPVQLRLNFILFYPVNYPVDRINQPISH